MSTTDPAEAESTTGAAETRGASAPPADAPAQPSDDAEPQVEREPVIEERSQEISLQRSVRYGRVIIGSAIAGIMVATLLALLTPYDPASEYTLGQIVGFMALIGGAIGLGVGAILAMILGFVAKRQRGTGVAIQTDVR